MTRHVIADLRLRDDETWVRCTCGELVGGADAESVNEPYQAHRVAHGQQARRFVSSDYRPTQAIRWSDGASAATAAAAESKRSYYQRNRERVLAQQREYQARKKGQAA